ncbi:MAG TPA: hypothetical protein VLT45_29060 [Kofleriaceae bacterium]|nr:hypothetical protein [Kofleriaceae bacterium]
MIVALLGSIASAQPANVDAEALFREGRRLLKEGNLAEACEKLEASARLDESVGTLLNVGDCREKNGQLATAWEAFVEAQSVAKEKHDDRAAVARLRADALEVRVPYVTIAVSDRDRVMGLTIAHDGIAVDLASWTHGVPLDPGIHDIVGTAPGFQPWHTQIDVTEGDNQHLAVPPLERMPPRVALSPPSQSARPDDSSDEREHASPPSRFTTLRKASFGTAAVGLVGIAGGIYWALEAKDLDREANAVCPGTLCSDGHALALNHSAQQDALASDAMFGVGGAALVGAAVMWWLGAPATITATDHSVAIAGRF